MEFEKKFNLRPHYLQVQSCNPFAGEVTGPRAAMYASEIGQAPPISNAEVKLIQSGMEREYGKYTSMVKMPANGLVELVHEHYTIGFNGGRGVTPPTTFIYKDESGHSKTATYGVVHIPSYVHNHHVLGFNYVRTPLAKSIRAGIGIPEGAVLAHSPSLVKPGGEYMNGVNANLCFISLPEVRQDGVIMSESFSKNTTFKGYEEVVLSFDALEIPLNQYGSDLEYKIFPDVGERIREDGIIFATRKLLGELYPVQMSRKALKATVGTDKIFRFKGDGSNATVVSVEVFHSPAAAQGGNQLPPEMAVQCERYLSRQRDVAEKLHRFYNSLYSRHPDGKFVLTPELQNLMARNLHYRNNGRQRGPALVENGVPLKEYTVKIVYSYDINPIAAYKMADGNGKRVSTTQLPTLMSNRLSESLLNGGTLSLEAIPCQTKLHLVSCA